MFASYTIMCKYESNVKIHNKKFEKKKTKTKTKKTSVAKFLRGIWGKRSPQISPKISCPKVVISFFEFIALCIKITPPIKKNNCGTKFFKDFSSTMTFLFEGNRGVIID